MVTKEPTSPPPQKKEENKVVTSSPRPIIARARFRATNGACQNDPQYSVYSVLVCSKNRDMMTKAQSGVGGPVAKGRVDRPFSFCRPTATAGMWGPSGLKARRVVGPSGTQETEVPH